MARIPWSARRAGTPETGETHVVVLITQRSRVQIPPPLPRCRSEALSEQGRGILHVVVHGTRGEEVTAAELAETIRNHSAHE
jgi:hypothetical protein